MTELRRREERVRMPEAAPYAAHDAAPASARQQSAFLANMSHEILTPINGVMGMLDALLDTRLSEDQEDLAVTAKSCAETLLSIIHDILDLSNIDAGPLTMDLQELDLRETLEQAVDLLAVEAKKKQLEIGVAIDPDLPRRVRGDSGRLRQILLHLAGNAIKFTQTGGVVIRASREKDEGNTAILRFAVADTGIGIDAQTRQRMFQPFVQADDSTTRRVGGTGLGLAISKRLAERMGGTIGVDSEEGKGSTFWFTGRFERIEPDEPSAPVPAPRVLIVDDSAAARAVLSSQVRSCGIESEVVADAASALALLHAAAEAGKPFDVVVSDHAMGTLDGITLARLIRAQPANGGIRFVLVSANGHMVAAESHAAQWVDQCLTKPVPQTQLRDAILGRPAARPANARILVVEDNAVNRKVVVRLLAKNGFQAETAANGLEALVATTNAQYDLVLMDCHMPEMDGFEATRAIRAGEGASRHVPILALTASAFQEDRDRCLHAGMDDVLTKPLRPADLERKLERWLGAAAMQPSADRDGDRIDDREPLDRDTFASLVELAGGDDLFVEELLKTYAEQSSELIAAASDAVRNGCRDDFLSAVHALNGSSRNIGALCFAQCCTEIETTLRERPAEPFAPRLEALRRAHEATAAAIETEMCRFSRIGV